MSHTDLAICAQIQALGLKQFRISVTAAASQKLPVKIPLKPMKTAGHAIDKVRYLRFSHSKGYHIGLIPLEPHSFVVLRSEDSAALVAALQQCEIAVAYDNIAYQETWLRQDVWPAAESCLQQAGLAYHVLDVSQGQAALAGFAQA